MSHLLSILDSRAEDVLHSTSETALSNLKIFFDFLSSNLLLSSILNELMKDLPDAEALIAKMNSSRSMRLPSSYLEKIKACLSILSYMISKNEDPWHLMALAAATSDAAYINREVLHVFFTPLYKYIREKSVSIDSFQFLLLRFKLKSEWFARESLFNLYQQDMSKGESILDNQLRAYLFDQGINFPFSKPSSPSGEVDVLSIIEQKPIPLEIKLFDGENRSKSHIRQGLIQALSYASDYGEPSGYLVIFNVSKFNLIFRLSSKDVPQRLGIGDKTIYFFIINLFTPEEPASRRNLELYAIDEEYLLEKLN